MVTSMFVISVIVISGIGYATQTSDHNDGSSNVTLLFTSIAKAGGPSYVSLTAVSPLPDSKVFAKAGPFAPGDSLAIAYSLKNVGNIPASLSSLAISVSAGGFSATSGPIPATLNPGSTFSSTITITLNSGLGDTYEGKSAIIALEISGVGTTATTSCTNTVTRTTTRTVTTTTTKTVTKTITKGQDSPLDLGPLWVTTSTCTTVAVTITSTYTTTYTSYTTITKTISTVTCYHHDDCR